MSITINIYYTGENDAARAFAEEMTESGNWAEGRRFGKDATEDEITAWINSVN